MFYKKLRIISVLHGVKISIIVQQLKINILAGKIQCPLTVQAI